MEQQFSNLFKKFRQNSNLSMKQIAKALNKSDGYFRKIENYNFTPPTYDVCSQLADLFNLNKKDRQNFMKTAFLERTQTEKAFLDEFSLQSLREKTTNCSQSIANQHQYFIQLKTYESQLFITPEIAKNVINFIENLGSTPQFKTIQIECYSDAINLIIEPNAPLNIVNYVEGIKPLIGGIINNYKTTIEGPVWDKNHIIQTIGTFPDSYQKFKKTVLFEKVITH